MKRFLLVGVVIFLTACSGSPISTGAQAEKNLAQMGDIETGMTSQEVFQYLGRPAKTERRIVDNQEYIIWFYMTKGTDMFQLRLTMRNYTPFVFKDRVLQGFGIKYYNYFFDINNAKERAESEKRQRYTDERDEWSPNENKILPPPTPKPEAAPQVEEKTPLEEKKESQCDEEEEGNPWWE